MAENTIDADLRTFRRQQPTGVSSLAALTMSNTTQDGPVLPTESHSVPQQSSSSPQQSSSTPSPSSSPPAAATTSSTPPAQTSSSQQPPPPATTSSSTPQQQSSTSHPTVPSSTSSVVQPSSTSSSSPPVQTSSSVPVVTVSPTNTATDFRTVTATTTQGSGSSPAATSSTSTATPTPIDPSGGGSGGGLNQASKVAIGVVVPIAAIAMLAIVGLFWWRKRRARQAAEEERRKEVEDYSYNPNADPTIPAVGLAPDNSYEMREDGAAGYRGWGSTTAAGSTGRKASTTMSGGGGMGGGYSDAASPTRGNGSEARSGEHLLDGASSPEGEILGAMGPSAANNRNGDVRRGPSNASSSYSAAGRSEGSDGGMYPNGGAYYDQYGQNPFGGDQRAQELPGQAVIRDNPARRNTRIENPAHYPQQSAGIAQNF